MKTEPPQVRVDPAAQHAPEQAAAMTAVRWAFVLQARRGPNRCTPLRAPQL